ncbi:MAG: FAD-dependent oxidoreductase [Bacteroidia bacterium]
MELSFWEAESFIGKPDVLIVGSGIVGLSAALHIRAVAPQYSVLVVERGPLPSGASTRNAGFACFGSMTELLSDLRTRPAAEVYSLVEKRWKGLQKLRNLCGDANMEFEQLGGFEIFTERDRRAYELCMEEKASVNQALAPIIGKKEVFVSVPGKIAGMGFSGVENMILNVSEGQIHTGKMMHTLLLLAREAGVEIINGLGIAALEDQGDRVGVVCENQWEFSAGRVLVATNGFASRIFPQLPVVPGRNQVWVTRPLEKWPVRGTFHYNEGYVYFRNVGNRLLIGGARNLDFEGEKTDMPGSSDIIQHELGRLVSDMILPGRKWAIDRKWSGIMGLGETKSPIVEKVSENVAVAVRLGGMGVAIGMQTGEEGATLIMR